MLCYVPFVGWLASIVVLASPRFLRDRTVRFHAFQGLYLFVTWLIIQVVVSPVMKFGHVGGPGRAVGGMLGIAVFIAWIFMLVKTAKGEFFSLPILGELADRSVAEQRPL